MQSLSAVQGGTVRGLNASEPGYQSHLESLLRDVFHGHNILTNTRKTVNIRSTETGLHLEIDAWIPDLQLAFEYQDPHHYITYWYANPTVHVTKTKDDMKRRLLQERSETLIAIPCWWDRSPESLIATVQSERPDLLQQFPSYPDRAIPSNPPVGFFKGIAVPSIGELMLASFYSNSIFNHSSWWMSEKYDGFRVCWHPSHKCVYSRFGARHEFVAEKLFHFMPTSFLDGEIWLGRNTFEEAQAITNKEYESIPWDDMRFIVFDSPSPSPSPFEERYALLLAHTLQDSPIIPVATARLNNKHHFKTSMKLILGDGGEGVILREPKSEYQRGKSRALLKFKAFRDSEGLIINTDEGQYTMQLPNGTVFLIADSPESATVVHKVTPTRGDIVTFSYSHLSNSTGLPQGVRMLRVRRDLTWELVVERAQEDDDDEIIETPLTTQNQSDSAKPHGYWADDSNVRSFFDSFARSQHKDPLDVETWYGFRSSDLPSGITSIVTIHGSYVNAVRHSYPELHFVEVNFRRKKPRFWKDVTNVREFFDKFAANANFDPLITENWYNINSHDITATKNGFSVLVRYNQVYSRALMDAYPELTWDVRFFRRQVPYTTMPLDYQKTILDRIADRRGFDPLVPSNWYSIGCADIRNYPAGASLLRHHNGGLIKALTTVYPSIGLDPLGFKKVALKYRKESNNLKQMVDKIAHHLGFDPKSAENWHSVSQNELVKYKGVFTVLRHFKTVANLVNAVYPDLELCSQEFFWKNPKNHRKILLAFANEHGFDPLHAENWYNINPIDLRLAKKDYVLRFYNRSVRNALISLFPDVPFDKNKFASIDESHKQLFDAFARHRKFDPQNTSNWYSIKSSEIAQFHKSGSRLIQRYGPLWWKALVSTYSNVTFEEAQFQHEQYSTV